MCCHQFFESASGSASSAKRQKIVHHQMEGPESDELPIAQNLMTYGDEQDPVDEDVMPGYHEEEHEQELEAWPVESHEQETSAVATQSTSNPTLADGTNAALRSRPPRPPNSAPGPSSQPLDADVSSRSTKPRSTIASSEPRSNAPGRTRVSMADWQNDLAAASSSTAAHGMDLTEDQDDTADMPCPICGDEKFTDNMALNAHIDWCLSRGVIRTAQGEARAGDGRSNDEDIGTDRKGATSARGNYAEESEKRHRENEWSGIRT